MEYLLGLDNGGTVTKAALFDRDGREVAVRSVNTTMLYPAPGHTERNLDDLWEANVTAIRDVLEQAALPPDAIRAVAVTGYGNGIILLDGEGKPVADGIISTDSRAREIVDRWYVDGTFETVFPMTFQSIWPAQPVALLAWFQRERPEVLERAAHVLMCKDYLRYRLTGEIAAEISDYSGTSAVDLNTREVSEKVLTAFGIPEHHSLFPPLVRSTEICGSITAAVAAETGLSAGTPVAGGLFDIHAAGVASGITAPGVLSCVAGTWTINSILVPRPMPQKDIFMNSVSPVEGLFQAMEGSPTSTSNLDWFIRENLPEKRREEEAAGRTIFDICNEAADTTRPEEADILFFPFLYGSNVGRPSKGAFLGLEGWHKRRHLIRAVYEGIMFSTKTHVDRLLRTVDKPAHARLAGGPARSETWVRLYADTLDMPVEVVDVTEMGALGAGICAAVAAGIYPDVRNAADAMCTIGSVIEPNPKTASILAEKYGRYREALEKTAALG